MTIGHGPFVIGVPMSNPQIFENLTIWSNSQYLKFDHFGTPNLSLTKRGDTHSIGFIGSNFVPSAGRFLNIWNTITDKLCKKYKHTKRDYRTMF